MVSQNFAGIAGIADNYRRSTRSAEISRNSDHYCETSRKLWHQRGFLGRQAVRKMTPLRALPPQVVKIPTIERSSGGLPPDSVYTTEVSDAMIRILRRRGFQTVTVADFSSASYPLKFDFIMCLNVVDRVDDPSSFLKLLTERMTPDGYLMLALSLPFCDHRC